MDNDAHSLERPIVFLVFLECGHENQNTIIIGTCVLKHYQEPRGQEE
jgi:hypothetical protein